MRGEVKAEAVPRSGERIHWNDPIAAAFRVSYPHLANLQFCAFLLLHGDITFTGGLLMIKVRAPLASRIDTVGM
jgi:hypothetical protein